MFHAVFEDTRWFFSLSEITRFIGSNTNEPFVLQFSYEGFPFEIRSDLNIVSSVCFQTDNEPRWIVENLSVE